MLGYIYIGRGLFENGGFILKPQQMFSVHTYGRRKNRNSLKRVSLDWAKKPHYRTVIDFKKLRLKMSLVCTNTQRQRFLNSSGLKCVFEKLRCREGLVWTVGLTLEFKLCFEFLRCSVNKTSVE